ncbi:MAG: ParA family protein [Flavobacteriaceae bacterium]
MSKIIAISNQKGGVGKTTTSVNLSAALSALEKKVLLIDFDPQANTSSSIGVEVNIGSKTIYDLLENKCSVNECIYKTKLDFLDVIPAHIDLVGIEIESIDMIDREYLLKNSINEIQNNYDYIIIDCPPSLGLLTINALSAANSVLIPIQCEYLALEGLGKLLNTIKSIQKIHNEELTIEGLLLTMFDTRLNLSNQVKKEVKLHFNEMVFRTVIHRNVKLGEATSFGKSIIAYDLSSKGADNYLNLAKELISKN